MFVKNKNSMIELKKFIKESGLSLDAIASELFPKNAKPRRALERVINGQGELTTSELSTLARILGVNPQDLVTPEGWKASIKGNVHVFTHNDDTAVLNLITGCCTMSRKGEKKCEFYLLTSSITLRGFIEMLNNKIESYGD